MFFLCLAVRAEAKDSVAMSRRAMALTLGMGSLALSAPARALIDFEEDDELLAKVKADRKAKVQKEIASEARFVKESGYTAKKFDVETAYLQKTINRLSKAGAAIESSDLDTLNSLVGNDDWVRDLKKATTALSLSEEAKTTATGMFGAIGNLQSAAKAKKKQEASEYYLGVIVGLEKWCTITDVAPDLKGL